MKDDFIDSPVIVAIDVDNEISADELLEKLDPAHCKVKVGKELFTRCGPEVVRHMVSAGFKVFLDLKFHDIPNTVAKAVAAASDLGVWMVNVHASGGSKMMDAAVQQLASMGSETLLVGVTVLTSFDADDLKQVGVIDSPGNQVIHLAKLAKSSGLDGVVCSAHEARDVANVCGDAFLRVTPGIRPASSATDDQSRVMTPASALNAGSTHLVIGRPITASSNPSQLLLEILTEIRNH